jgi:hypothetical protein
MTAKQLILHIGCPKTGTTTLQDALLASRAYLRDQGIVMPNGALIQGNAVKLGYEIFDFHSFESERKTWLTGDLHKARFEAKAAWDDLAMKASRDRPDKILISSEHFMRQFAQASYANAKQHLWHISQDVKIVAYLRSPASRFLSFHQQRLKVAGADLTLSRRDEFSAQIKGFAENISPHVAVRVFDRTKLFQGDIVADFCRHHLPDTDVGKLTRSPRELNTTMSAEAMAILKDCHNGTLDFNFPMRLLADMLERLDSIVANPTKPALSDAAKQSVNNWHTPDLLKLRDQHNIVFPDVAYDDLTPDAYDPDILNYRRLEDICLVDQSRKSKLLRRLRLQTYLPKALRPWAGKW